MKKKYQPYKLWSNDKLWSHLELQCEVYGFCKKKVKEAVFDKRWNPITDYNGCTMVQDPLHPYLPCFLHDYGWIVLGGGIEFDKEFIIDNEKVGEISEKKIEKWFLGVRLGWIFYHKWKKLLKKRLTS